MSKKEIIGCLIVAFFIMAVGIYDVANKENINLTVRGEQMNVSTFKKTVGDLFEELEITYDEDDKISPSIDTVLLDDMAIEFIEVTKEVVVEEEEIPFEVTTVDDKNILKGKSEVKQEGVVGKKELTYDLTYENGVLVQKTLESEIVSVEPIEKIVHNGIKEEIKVASRGSKGYMSVIATAYSGDTITSTGTTPKWGTIAVDPSVIPYGTKVYIPQFDKVFVAEDCGGAIKGNKIDIFMNSNSQCNNWGRRRIDIYIVS